MRRRSLALLVTLSLGLATWLRSDVAPPDRHSPLQLDPVPLAQGCCRSGPFRLVGAWHLRSRHAAFGGYSALLSIGPGRLVAFSDRGYSVEFPEPGTPPFPSRFGSTQPDSESLKNNRDVESATRDPETGTIWLAQEGRDAVTRYDANRIRQRFQKIPEWQGWPNNSGPEALVRLRDGRFIVLCECRTSWLGASQHPAFVYSGDPADGAKGSAFTFAGVNGFRPTDAAQLPDGRVLILERRLVWPMPARFAIRLVLADPDSIRSGAVWQGQELGAIAAPWPVDNYEGLAIERQADGSLVAWIISDENSAVSQRALLLKVAIDEGALPRKQKAPEPAGRP